MLQLGVLPCRFSSLNASPGLAGACLQPLYQALAVLLTRIGRIEESHRSTYSRPGEEAQQR